MSFWCGRSTGGGNGGKAYGTKLLGGRGRRHRPAQRRGAFTRKRRRAHAPSLRLDSGADRGRRQPEVAVAVRRRRMRARCSKSGPVKASIGIWKLGTAAARPDWLGHQAGGVRCPYLLNGGATR
ncbi:putative E3 ubiquitin protein ligase RIE1 [Iris pallida]|uniref:E3 ubiquitin protein ligase RIE1 n=1 Tax=Iris pallida TaxID=29817 RepID=A0AAX6G3T0_IRIPA|nr:putative E3 ubiquitin protein ligase RIE1 [Iris pallida]